MKKWLLAAVVAMAMSLGSVPAHARKACDELKQEIAARIDAKGVKGYTLEIIAADAVDRDKVVGSCAGGTQRITYRRGPTLGDESMAGRSGSEASATAL
jgi:hypothetical protein